MFQRKSVKPSISQFDISQVQNILSSTATNPSNPSNASNKTQGIRYQQVRQLLKSKAQQNNDNDPQQELRMTHRQSKTALDIFRKKVSSGVSKNPEADLKTKDPLYETLLKRVQGDQTIIHELKHNLEETDKRTSDRSRKLEKQFQGMKTQFARSFQKMVQQIKCKFTNVDSIVQGLRTDVDSLKQGGVNLNSLVSMSISKPKEKQAQKQIIYDLDVKSSIDGLRGVIPSSDHSIQMTQLKTQIQILRQEISNQQTTKTKASSQYEQLRNEFQSMSMILSSRAQQKISQCQRVLKEHDQNIQKINQEFQKVINQQISPRILAIENNLQLLPQMINKHDGFKKIIDEFTILKNDLQEKLKNSEVVRVRKIQDKEKQAFKKSESIDMNNTYYIDTDNYLLDCKGTLILDQNDKKIKIQEDYIYFLNLHGINIMNIQ